MGFVLPIVGVGAGLLLLRHYAKGKLLSHDVKKAASASTKGPTDVSKVPGMPDTSHNPPEFQAILTSLTFSPAGTFTLDPQNTMVLEAMKLWIDANQKPMVVHPNVAKWLIEKGLKPELVKSS